MQDTEQPSWELVLLSSHISGDYTTPFPQTGITEMHVPSITNGYSVPVLHAQELFI